MKVKLKHQKTTSEGQQWSFVEHKDDEQVLGGYQRPLWLARSCRRVGEGPTSQNTLGSRGSRSVCRLLMSDTTHTHQQRQNTRNQTESKSRQIFRETRFMTTLLLARLHIVLFCALASVVVCNTPQRAIIRLEAASPAEARR